MLIKPLAVILSLIVTVASFAQSEVPDNLTGPKTQPDTVASYLKPIDTPLHYDSNTVPTYGNAALRHIESTLSAPSVFMTGFNTRNHGRWSYAPGMVGYSPWSGASVYAAGSSSHLPGFMGIENGRVGFSQQIGNISVNIYGSASHYGYFRGMQTSWGIGADLTYRFNDRWSLTVFGSYATGLTPLTPAMAAYMNVPNFGGYASYEIDDHWGIKVGAQATRSLVTNRWEAQPIVEPYYKINGKAAIGVDVGGILYNLIKSANENRNGYRPNPTLGPPVGGPPPVAPRPDK